ncbi:MAG: hypothetical protein JNM17_22305 [Archangium sp.]|nr:hypothetical protein [Archangium sp.]
MTLLAALLGAVSVALISSSALSRRRAAPRVSGVTLAHFDEASIPRTVH